MTENNNRMGVYLPFFFIEESKANELREIADDGPLNISQLMRYAVMHFLEDYELDNITHKKLKAFAAMETLQLKRRRRRGKAGTV